MTALREAMPLLADEPPAATVDPAGAATAGAAAPSCTLSRFDWDHSKASLDIDPAWLHDFRHTPHSVAAELAMNWRTLIYAADVPAVEQAFAAVRLDPGRVLDVEARMVALDGTVGWFRLLARVHGWKQLLPVRIVGSIENTTRRRATDLDLRGQIAANPNFIATFGYPLEELLGHHLCLLVDPEDACSSAYRDFWGQVDAIHRSRCAIEYDLEGRVLRANDNFLALLGYRLEEIVGMPHRAFMMSGEDDEAGCRRRWAALAAGRVESGEFRRRRKDGTPIWISGTYHPILDPRGRPIKIVHYCSDATERVATQLALRDNELKLRGLFELSPAGIALIDEESGRILEANDALARLLNLRAPELVGRGIGDFIPGAPGSHLPLALEGKALGSSFEPVEINLRAAGGVGKSALLSGMRTTDPGGQRRVWAIVQDISERKLAERELERAALTDGLTGLANRSAFVRALEEAVARFRERPEAKFAMLLLDFDRFKVVNNTLGHAAGDELLRHIGDRLRARVRTGARDGSGRMGGMAARFGGDEFAVLVVDLKDEAELEPVVERLLAGLSTPYALQGRQIHSSASIGVFVASDPTLSAGEVMQQADLAMNEAKHRGRNRAARFDAGMQSRPRRRLTLENDLREAIDAQALTVAYQPIVDLETGRIEAAEALVRWTHPTLGPISPAEFVPIAEDANLIVPLGALVLEASCAAFLQWRRSDPRRAPGHISVNLSRVELALGEEYLQHLVAVLARTGMPAECLLLEVTEREIMRNPALSLEQMKRLKTLGVRLAMDDFGTGASSLSCLRDYPFDIIKVDRSFLANLEEQRDVLMVLHATITLIGNLGMTSVAEGIEQPAQAAVLQTIGCRYGQGFLFSQAVPAEAFLAIDALAAWRAADGAPR